MKEGKPKSVCIWKVKTIFRRTKVKVTFKLRGNVESFLFPLIWLFCSKVANNEIDRTHKRALRTLYRDYESTFEELLDRGDTKTTHKKNLQNLMVEIYKSMNHLNPEYMWDFFFKKDVPYNPWTKELYKLPSVSSQRYGMNSLSLRGSLLWNALSDDLKLTTSLVKFKKEIRCWDGNNCTCYICT